MKRLILSALLINLLAACASQAPKEQPKAAVEERPATQAPAPAAQTQPAPTSQVEENPLTNPSSFLHKSVYFDFDKSEIKDEFKPVIQADANYLSGHSNVHVQIQGNCDERGSVEYNLALGQRRADAAASALKVLGVGASQIGTVSFGKEKPKCTEHNEACWSQNRRDDFVYSTN